jgi:hypothetical protein
LTAALAKPSAGEDPARWLVKFLESLPEPVDPSTVVDRLVDMGFLRCELEFYDQLTYMTTEKGRQFLEWIEQQPQDPYPDTGESGETYDLEQGGWP